MGLRLHGALMSLGERTGRWPCWLLAGCLIGAAPMSLTQVIGLAPVQVLTGVLLFPFVAAAALRDWLGRGLLIMIATFAAHSAVVITVFAHDPASLPGEFPAGAAYWDETHAWLTTGVSREYDLNWWLPAHLQLLLGACLFAYTSLGSIPFCLGLHEVDLMNAYVSQLLLRSHNPWTAMALGWHPWSVCRGLGYLFVLFEVSSLSLGRLLGLPLSTLRRRCERWLG